LQFTGEGWGAKLNEINFGKSDLESLIACELSLQFVNGRLTRHTPRYFVDEICSRAPESFLLIFKASLCRCFNRNSFTLILHPETLGRVLANG